MKKILVFVFTGLGIVLTLLILVGVVMTSQRLIAPGVDMNRLIPPTPASLLNWDEADVTKTGVVRRGYVLHALLIVRAG